MSRNELIEQRMQQQVSSIKPYAPRAIQQQKAYIEYALSELNSMTIGEVLTLIEDDDYVQTLNDFYEIIQDCQNWLLEYAENFETKGIL